MQEASGWPVVAPIRAPARDMLAIAMLFPLPNRFALLGKGAKTLLEVV